MLVSLVAFSSACSGPSSLTDRSTDSKTPSGDAENPPVETSSCERELGLTNEQCTQVAKLALPAQLKPAAGNRYADDEAAARLGFLVFYDQGFSSIPDVRCATCHLPESSFGDGKAVSEVIAGRPVPRNSPSILNAAWAGDYYFWDGRADSLWSQPLFAFENPDEMASSRLAIAHRLFDQSLYRARYEELFGEMPPLSDLQRFPPSGKPGEPSFDQMRPEDQDVVNWVVANLGKALEAYMRKVATGPSALDQYLAGDSSALEPTAKKGLSVFVRAGCIECHSGPALSDGAFYNLGLGGSDEGRAGGLVTLQTNPFNSRGKYFDKGVGVAPSIPDAPAPGDRGAFRTPTLRNLARTAPYGHDGRFATLEDVLDSLHGESLAPGDREPLMIFLLSLNGAYPSRPWSDWPAR